MTEVFPRECPTREDKNVTTTKAPIVLKDLKNLKTLKTLNNNKFTKGGTKSTLKTNSTTRGMTHTLRHVSPVTDSFNPRAHAGRDSAHQANTFTPYEFQSTRPCGARLFSTQFTDYQSDISKHLRN